MNSAQSIYQIVSRIPKGKVATYGQIAKRAGIQSPRYVGSVLHKNPDPKSIPCHRVVSAKGKLAQSFAFGGLPGQAKKLESEGILVLDGTVHLPQYSWEPENENFS